MPGVPRAPRARLPRQALRFRCRGGRCRSLSRGRAGAAACAAGAAGARWSRGLGWRSGRRRSLWLCGGGLCRCSLRLAAGLLLGLLASLLLGFLASLLLGFLPGALLRLAAGTLLGLLALALQTGALLLGAEHVVSLRDDLADRLGHRGARADRVVVSGDHVVDPVGIAVGVDEADDRDPQALGLAHGDRLGLEVDHEHRVRDPLHVLDAAEIRAQLLEVGLSRHPLPGGQQLELAFGLVALEVVQPPDPQ